MEDRREMLGNGPVGWVLWKLSFPAMTGMLVIASYNLVDTIVIGWDLGPMGIAATAAAFPVQFFVNAVAMWSAIGTASLTARALGARQQERAEAALASGLTVGLVMALICLIVGRLFLDQLVRLAGATEAMAPLTKTYLRVTFWGAPVIMLGSCLNNTIRAEGNTRYAMVSQLIAALTNCVLDPIFVFVMGWGVDGVAWATVIGQVAMFVWGLAYYLRGRQNMVALKFSLWKPRPDILKETLTVGFSEFARIGANCVAIALLMNSAVRYGSEIHLAAYGVVSRLTTITLKPIFGLGQGLLPLVGYNYGAGNYDRARKAVFYALIGAMAFTLTVSSVFMIFPQAAVQIFSDDPELLRAAAPAVRIVLSLFCLAGFHVVGTVTFQALGFAKEAIFLSLCRKLIFLVPMMILLPPLMGITGVFMVYPASDLLSFCCCAYLLFRHRRDLETSLRIPVEA